MPQETRVKSEKTITDPFIYDNFYLYSAENEISLKNLENLAKQGNLAAQIELAKSYRKGIRVTRLKNSSKMVYPCGRTRGCSITVQSRNYVQFWIGCFPNYRHGAKWYTLAAEQGHALAQYNLGRLY